MRFVDWCASQQTVSSVPTASSNAGCRDENNKVDFFRRMWVPATLHRDGAPESGKAEAPKIKEEPSKNPKATKVKRMDPRNAEATDPRQPTHNGPHKPEKPTGQPPR